ncbi:hypothetical protein [Lysinibacillus xylanilyticus]|uniref:Uncharacterized protein n=1 Tax=Lysinibacillus xylanilyticus TaxID=582475 RepID=A0ABT4EWL1_9BACI|nr:hypothetical protein [Lysinibacillus xylanilyticus]MCY9550060.1 hypothetical protein [Lysinibacillus xylanilyticus]
MICRTQGSYSEALTRGITYQVIDINNDKEMVRIKCDNGRLSWFPLYHFNMNSEDVIDLISWKFDDEVSNDANETNWIEISLKMSDGSERWCILYTPERLRNCLQQPNVYPTGLHIKHMIVVKSYNVEDIQSVLDYLNQEDELIGATLPL